MELEEKRKEAQQWLDKFEKLAAKENNVKLKSEIIEWEEASVEDTSNFLEKYNL